jgi:hypothetical protein
MIDIMARQENHDHRSSEAEKRERERGGEGGGEGGREGELVGALLELIQTGGPGC